MEKVRRIVLAYSGGLDTSVILHWLIKEYNAEVVAFIADLGQEEDFKSAVKKAYKLGAKRVFLEDVREEFVKDFVFPMLRANAMYEGYLLGTSIARPVIAKKQMELAKKAKADGVSHGATGKGNDQVRFELTYYTINPSIKVITPWREWGMRSRSDLIEYALKNKIPVEATKKKPYSTDRNLFHVSHEGGILEDPSREFPLDILETVVPPEKAPDKPEYIEINYEKGNPVAVNGKKISPAKLLSELNKIGGRHGVGILDLVENRYVGMKSRGVYETPGGTILHAAHRALESITIDREVMRLRDSLIPKYSELVYYGYWFSPERQLLQTVMDRAQENVTGSVRLKIYKGNVYILSREAKRSLFSKEVASFEADKIYNQSDATGFIKINALRLILNKLANKS